MKIDETDLRILEVLEKDSKLSIREISKLLKKPLTTVHNRIKRLEDERIIRGYTLKLDYGLLGKTVAAFIFMTVESHGGKKISQREICEKIISHREVLNASIVAGNKDIIVKVRVDSIAKLNEFIMDFLRNIEGVDKTETMIVLEEVEK